LPHVLSTSEKYRDIYTVFAGGDDLFLAGPWDTILEFSQEMNEKFRNYTCRNPDITISAGISLIKSRHPINSAAFMVERMLEESKNKKKNRLTVFDTTIKWNEFKELKEYKDNLQNLLLDKDSKVSTSFIYSLLTIKPLFRKGYRN
jgi:CRISPR-associated protein Csm1